MDHSANAVSYTHLDVYKRQAQYLLREYPPGSNAPPDTPATVVYRLPPDIRPCLLYTSCHTKLFLKINITKRKLIDIE